jgi:hypothetical protein
MTCTNGGVVMAWFLPRVARVRARDSAPAHGNEVGASPAEFDRLLDGLREVRIAVPCPGCGGAHEMTCAEIVARQLIGGNGWPSEECDDGVALASLLSPEDVVSCGGDPGAITAMLARRGVLSDRTVAVTGHVSAGGPRMLPNY